MVPREAKLIRKAGDDVLAGSSLRSVGGEWKNSGVTTPHSAKTMDLRTVSKTRKRRSTSAQPTNGDSAHAPETEHWFTALDELPNRTKAEWHL